MHRIELQVNGQPLIFDTSCISYGSNIYPYSQISNIAHRQGEPPVFLFDYNGERTAVPYDADDKDIVMSALKKIIREQNAEKAAVPIPDPTQMQTSAQPTATEPITTVPQPIQSSEPEQASNESQLIPPVEAAADKSHPNTSELQTTETQIPADFEQLTVNEAEISQSEKITTHPSDNAPTDDDLNYVPDNSTLQYHTAKQGAAGNNTGYTYVNNNTAANQTYSGQTYNASGTQQEKEPLSSRTWFVILLLILFFPVGLYLMWSRKKFTQVARIIITVVIGLLVLLNVFFTVALTTYVIDETIDTTIDELSEYSDDLNDTTDSTEPTAPTDTPPQNDPDATLGEKNALGSAENYLSFMAFSYSGLIDQLEFEGYTTEEATYAADNCGADWNEQAAKSAESYMEIMSFSKTELIDQLEFEGFTREQAEYGAESVGY